MSWKPKPSASLMGFHSPWCSCESLETSDGGLLFYRVFNFKFSFPSFILLPPGSRLKDKTRYTSGRKYFGKKGFTCNLLRPYFSLTCSIIAFWNKVSEKGCLQRKKRSLKRGFLDLSLVNVRKVNRPSLYPCCLPRSLGGNSQLCLWAVLLFGLICSATLTSKCCFLLF